MMSNNMTRWGVGPKFALINDYPLIKGKEVMVEAVFEGRVGQAFTDEFEQASYRVEDLLEIECDGIFATGSTIVNATITNFLFTGKPILFYGVTISAAAKILNLLRYCHCGR